MRQQIRQPYKGQALTEFLVLALALVPLFLLIPLVAKYQDISHANQIASRYVAFEAVTRNPSTVNNWKPESQLADEVRRRFFTNTDAAIKSNDATDNSAAQQNLFWRNYKSEALINNVNNDVTLSFGFDQNPTQNGAFNAASDGNPFLLNNQFNLAANGIYTANVTTKLANLPAGLLAYEPFNQINLSMRRSTSIVLDPWQARNPQQVENNVGNSSIVFPSNLLTGISPLVNGVINVIDLPGNLSGPKLGELEFWRDVVPQDRLKKAE